MSDTLRPICIFAKREIMVEEYEKALVNKALAVNLRERRVLANHGSGQQSRSRPTGRSKAASSASDRRAKLLAVNDDTGSNLAGRVQNKTCRACAILGGFDINQLPIVKDDVRKRSDIQAYLSARRPKAIAIHPNGQMFVNRDPQTGQGRRGRRIGKMRFCVGQKEVRIGPCYLYALNNDIVIAKRHTFPAMPNP